MCIVSNIGDGWGKSAPAAYPQTFIYSADVTRAEFDALRARNERLDRECTALRADLESLKEWLRFAKVLDAATGQPDCEVDEKVELIRRLAELVGVDVGDLFA